MWFLNVLYFRLLENRLLFLKKSKIELSFPFQRQAKYTENKLKAIKARNEYLLALEATNASVFKYYIHDLSDLIDVSAESWGSRVPLSWFRRSGQASPVLLLRHLRDFENNHKVAMIHLGLAMHPVPGEALYTTSPSVLISILGARLSPLLQIKSTEFR